MQVSKEGVNQLNSTQMTRVLFPNSVDNDWRLKADYSPCLDGWTVVQQERFVIY